MIILNSLFPIFTLLLLGSILKRMGLTDGLFLRTSDRLIYYFFFPVMLFWKIGGASLENGIDWNFCLASLATLIAMYLLSTLIIKFLPVSDFQAGSFSQSCYRFNTYIGVAVILNSLGAEGVKYFGIMIGFAIPAHQPVCRFHLYLVFRPGGRFPATGGHCHQIADRQSPDSRLSGGHCLFPDVRRLSGVHQQ